MSKRAHKLDVSKGTVLFAPGQPCPGFVQLHKGTIRVTLTAENGREVVLYRVRPGEICLQTFSCLINHSAYSAEGVAESDLQGILLTPEMFHEKLADDPAFRGQVFAAVAHRFSDFEHLIEDIALIGFDARLARALLRLRDDVDVVAATHDRLAGEIASGRAFVSRRLAEFARQGLIEQGRGTLALLDIKGLEQIAADTG